MIEHLYLGPVPCNQSCAQVGQPDYAVKGYAECEAFKNQIGRVLALRGVEMTHGVKLTVKSNEHDFGTYYEVTVAFDPDNKDAIDLVCKIEDLLPSEWDTEALMELAS